MANVCQLLWGNRSLDLLTSPYSPQSDGVVGLLQPAVTELAATFGPAIIAGLSPTDVQFTMTLKILGSTAAARLNAISSLKLLVDGPYQIAAQEGQNPVYLALDVDGGGGTMLFRVRYGNVDDGGSHFIFRTATSQVSPNVVLWLRLENAGTAQTPITLRNRLFNPDFTIDTGGLATSWTHVGTPTTTINTTNYLINGQAQKVVADAGNEGIHSEDKTGVTDAAAFAWVYVVSGSVVVAIRDTGGPTDLENATLDATDSNNVSDKTAIDEDGKTWYRVPLSGTFASATIDLCIRSATGVTATFYVDGCYLATETTTVPDCWAGYYNLDNRGDRSTTNPTYVTHIDLWGVPGDMPAYLKTVFASESAATGNAKRLYYAAQTDGKYPVCDSRHWIESDELTYATLGTGAWSNGAGTTGNHYKRFTEGAGVEGGTFELSDFADPLADFQSFWSVPRRILLLCRSNAAAAVTITSSDSGETVSLTANNTWELVDLGTINRVGELNPAANTFLATDLTTLFTVGGLANTNTFDIDALLALPIEQGTFLFVETNYDVFLLGTPIDYITDGALEGAYGDNGFTGIFRPALGNLWTVPAGNRVTRLIHLLAENDNEYSYAQEQSVILTVTPRARLLLGNQTTL